MVSNFPGAFLWTALIVVFAGLATVVGAWLHLMTKRACPHCKKLLSKKLMVCPYCGKGTLVAA
jgi:hypothetical protein